MGVEQSRLLGTRLIAACDQSNGSGSIDHDSLSTILDVCVKILSELPTQIRESVDNKLGLQMRIERDKHSTETSQGSKATSSGNANSTVTNDVIEPNPNYLCQVDVWRNNPENFLNPDCSLRNVSLGKGLCQHIDATEKRQGLDEIRLRYFKRQFYLSRLTWARRGRQAFLEKFGQDAKSLPERTCVSWLHEGSVYDLCVKNYGDGALFVIEITKKLAQTLQLEEPQGRAFFADLERRKVKDAAKHFALVGKCLSECLLRTHKEEGIFLEPPPENNHADKCSATSRPRKKHKPWHTSSHVFPIDQTLTRAATRVNGEAVWSITDQNARHAPQGLGDEQQMGSSHTPETPMGRAGGTQQSQSPNHSSGTRQMGRNTNDLNDTSMDDSIIWQNHPPAQHIQVLSVRESLVPVRSSRSECSTPIVETSTSPLNMTSPAQSLDATLEAPLAMDEQEVAALRACRLSPSTLEGNNNGGHSGRMVPRGSRTTKTARFQMAPSSRSSYKSPYPHTHEPCLDASERLERSPTTRPASDSMMIGSQTTETPMSQSISTSLHPANDAQSFTPSHCMSQEVIAAGPRLSTTGFSPSTRSLEPWPQNIEPQSRGLSHEATESPRSLDELQDNIPNRPSLRQSNAMAIRNLLGESLNLPSHNFSSAPEISEMQDSLPELESDTPRWEPSLPKFLESDIGDTATPRNRLESDAEDQPEDAVAESQPTHVRPFHQRQHSSSIIQGEHDHPTDSSWSGHFSLASVCPPTGDATFPGEGNFPKVVGSERSNEMEDAHLVETGIRTDVHNPLAEAVGNIPEANSGGGDRPQESPRVLDDPRYEALFDTNDLFPDWDEPLDPDYIVPESV